MKSRVCHTCVSYYIVVVCVCLQLLDAAFSDVNLSKFLVREKIEPFRGFGGVRNHHLSNKNSTSCVTQQGV